MTIAMIIAVSDIHLGDPNSNRVGFIHFIEEFLKPKREEITQLILLGDVLDLWRRDPTTVILENLGVFNNLCSLGFHVYYVVGNHDFIMIDIAQGQTGGDVPAGLACNPTNMTVCQEHQLVNGGNSFRFIHGHQINYWYALPFYEMFSRAMCNVNNQVSELADVWRMLQRTYGSIPLFTQQRIDTLSYETRIKFENKLAGPLEGHSMSIEESIVVESNLLNPFVEIDFHKNPNFQKQTLDSICKSIRELITRHSIASNIESLVELSEMAEDCPLEEIASNYLIVWEDIYRWIVSNRGMAVQENRLLSLNANRIAAMFNTDLTTEEFLIHGHGHRAFVNHQFRIADTGCWIKDAASFITIDDGEVTSNSWPIL
ncbi:MAG: metallophosphoesterase [Candidatus Thorarchaeota archaeon]